MPKLGQIKACVFDAYGTLFDVHSAIGKHKARVGADADRMSVLWRAKQLEYTWLRSLMGAHADFWKVTGDALDYAMDTYGMDDMKLRDDLMRAYLELDCYPEVMDTLTRLKKNGMRTAILSNGSRHMIEQAAVAAGIDTLLDAIYTIDDVTVYKPHPRVYGMACARLNLEAGEISFQSSNAWDAAGAAQFGLKVVWINRSSLKPERLPASPDAVLENLSDLPDLVC